MIALESFKTFRIIDLTVIVLTSFLSYILDKLSLYIPSLEWSFIISTLTTAILMSFTVLLIRKAGSATIFYIIRAMLIYKTEGVGPSIFLVLITAGVIFEIVFLLLKLEIKNIPVDIVLGVAFSNLTIPIMTALLLSTKIATIMLYNFINLILVYFIMGIAGAVISFMIWNSLKFTKLVMKFEYMQ